MKKPKVYIAGAISGVPNYKEIFEAKRAELQFEYGDKYEFICPHDFVEETETWENAIIKTLTVLKDCDYIYFLKKYGFSTGANIEYLFAEKIGVKLFINQELNNE